MRVLSEETKSKISQSLMGHSVSKEARKKISDKNKGRVLTAETKERIGLYWRGRKRGVRNAEYRKKLSEARKGKRASIETRRKIGLSHSGEKNYAWKGEDCNYRSLHVWVSRHKGKPDACEHCPKKGLKGRQIHWASKSRRYKRDLQDWLRLCAQCHRNYDKLVEMGNIKKKYV